MVKPMELWAPNHPVEYGGLGMTDNTIISCFYRHERAARIYDGADEVHEVSVARRILRDYENRTVR
jgi:alkylation response protein AidB-like acyl-CoA dehydrogenase